MALEVLAAPGVDLQHDLGEVLGPVRLRYAVGGNEVRRANDRLDRADQPHDVAADAFLVLDADAVHAGAQRRGGRPERGGLAAAPVVVDELGSRRVEDVVAVEVDPHAAGIVAQRGEAHVRRDHLHEAIPLHGERVPVLVRAAGKPDLGALAPARRLEVERLVNAAAGDDLRLAPVVLRAVRAQVGVDVAADEPGRRQARVGEDVVLAA